MRFHADATPTRTKLIATLGPACADEETLRRMLDAGLDACRINFSHAALEEQARVLRTVRALAAERGRHLTLIGDLCGPKIRLNRVAGGEIELRTGASVRIVRGAQDCTADALTTTYPSIVDEVGVGQRVLIDDGLVRLLVVERQADALLSTCTVGGRISSRKGVNLPDTRVSAGALSAKDLADLDWAVANGLDYVALSFVRTPDDVARLRAEIRRRRADVGVIVKIEKSEALEHLDALIGACDALLVARGDLGVEMDVWQVPLVQKALTARCREAGVPVIIATQMLQSMVDAPMPTRAEVSDVANAILDAADAVMLSAETAVGRFAAHAVDILNRVARVTEAYLASVPVRRESTPRLADLPTPAAVASAAAQAARELSARLVAVWTASGRTARLVARERLPVPVVGLTADPRVARRMNLVYGIQPVIMEPVSDLERMFAALDQRLVELRLARGGDRIVVVTSTRPDQSGGTNTLLVHTVGAHGGDADSRRGLPGPGPADEATTGPGASTPA